MERNSSSPCHHPRSMTEGSDANSSSDSSVGDLSSWAAEIGVPSTDPGRRLRIWDVAFRSGLFSDIAVVFCNRTFKLHRVVVLQSPLFARIFLTASSSPASSSDDSFFVLETGGDKRITVESIEVVLHDLYNTAHRVDLIKSTNAANVLAAACFLELDDLATYCSDFILRTSSAPTIMGYAEAVDVLRPPPRTVQSPYGGDHAYFALLRTHHTNLQSGILSYLCQTVNLALSLEFKDGASKVNDLFATMPVSWLRRVMECNALCIANEFERYELLKRVTLYRRQALRSRQSMDGKQASHSNSVGETSNPSVLSASSPSSFASKLFGMLGGGGPSKRSRCDDDQDEARCAAFTPDGRPLSTASHSRKADAGAAQTERSGLDSSPLSIRTSPTHSGRESRPGLCNLYGELQGALSGVEEQEDAVIFAVFQTGIIYTYMTFAQLELVKSDRIVPDSSILHSFWTQAELASRMGSPVNNTRKENNPASSGSAGHTTKPFRFAARFRHVYEYFTNANGGGAVGKAMISDPVKCAGVDYRVLLGACQEVDTSMSRSAASVATAPAGGGLLTPAVSAHPSRSGSVEDLRQSSSSSSATSTVADSQKGLVLKAHLQRTRSTGGYAGPITYNIYVFDAARFSECSVSGSESWKQFHKPLTACDFDGNGYVKTFPMPLKGNDPEAGDSGGVWLIVNIHLPYSG
ncbi:hypothetical protein DFJ73DRAFT_831726 [Zopfochytrium polystomum]|nr:hypothetical protein DFJ73DRAFT_831726 [Zopfochytrium polystomum]